MDSVQRLRLVLTAVLAAFATSAGTVTLLDSGAGQLARFVAAALIFTAFAILADERADARRAE